MRCITEQEIDSLLMCLPGDYSILAICGQCLRRLRYSPGISNVLGYTEEEYHQMADQDALQIVYSGDRERLIQSVQKCLDDGVVDHGNYRMVKKDGTCVWVHTKSKLIGELDGNLIILVLYTDTSAASDCYQVLLDHSMTQVYVSDAQTREILYSNTLKRHPDHGKMIPYQGISCHEYIKGLDHPCPDCLFQQMHFGEFRHSECYMEDQQRWLSVAGERICWGGRDAVVHYIEDITDSKNMQIQLENTRERYELAIEGAELGVWEYDIPAHTIFSPSRSFEKFGITSAITNVPQSILPLFLEEERPRLLAMFDEIHSGKPKVSGSFWMQWKADMAPQYERCTYSVVTDDAGRPIKACGIGQNITAQKLEEQRYSRTIQDLLQANPLSLCVFRLNLTQNQCYDGQGSSTYIQNMISADTADQMFSNIAAIITAQDDAEKFNAQFNRKALLYAFHAGNRHISLSYRRMVDTGDSHWVTTYINMLKNPSTNDVEAIVYSVDTNHEKEEEQIIAAITQREYDYIALIDVRDGSISFYTISDKTVDTMPFQRERYEDSVQESFMTFADIQDRQRCLKELALSVVLDRLQENEDYAISFLIYSSKGDLRRKQMSFRYLNETKQKILLTRSDVTAAFQQEENQTQKIKQALLSAERANEMKTDFLSNVSHDMRTPLNAVLGYAGLARQSDDPVVVRRYIEKIENAGTTLLSLINDTLDLQKIETGAITLKQESISCGEIIHTIITAVQPLIQEKHIDFVLDNSRSVMATINVDAMRLEEICINLLSNAAKYTPAGGRVEFVVECLKLEQHRVHDRLVVRDTGIGISKEFLPKIFEPFSQERTAETAHIGGSGLGLSIVHRLVQLMGGHIEVCSELGKGSEFSVYLDFERIEDVLPEAMPDEMVSLDSLYGKTVLLCEDNMMNIEIAKTLLEMQKMNVVTAENGQAGVDIFTASPAGTFAAVLMDIRMPIMNGYEAAAQIRASNHPDAADIPIIAMSADAYEADVQRSMNSGMNGHIAKPVDPLVLFTQLARLIANRSEHDE